MRRIHDRFRASPWPSQRRRGARRQRRRGPHRQCRIRRRPLRGRDRGLQPGDPGRRPRSRGAGDHLQQSRRRLQRARRLRPRDRGLRPGADAGAGRPDRDQEPAHRAYPPSRRRRPGSASRSRRCSTMPAPSSSSPIIRWPTCAAASCAWIAATRRRRSPISTRARELDPDNRDIATLLADAQGAAAASSPAAGCHRQPRPPPAADYSIDPPRRPGPSNRHPLRARRQARRRRPAGARRRRRAAWRPQKPERLFRVLQDVNLRQGPGNDFPRIGALARGTVVRVDGEDKGWLRRAPAQRRHGLCLQQVAGRGRPTNAGRGPEYALR